LLLHVRNLQTNTIKVSRSLKILRVINNKDGKNEEIDDIFYGHNHSSKQHSVVKQGWMADLSKPTTCADHTTPRRDRFFFGGGV